MNKQKLILKYFQKKRKLTVKNSFYRKSLTSLFQYLIKNDEVNSDFSTRLLALKSKSRAKIISHQPLILAGLKELNFLLSKLTPLSFKPMFMDGEEIRSNKTIALISGNSAEILSYERIILNLLQRTCGIATQTYHLNKLINLQPTTYNPPPFIAATRKTPFLLLDKKAVSIGGGLTHRLNLADGILIKDNHFSVLHKDVSEVLISVNRKVNNHLIEIEITQKDMAFQLIKTYQKLHTNNYLAIMFDNFSPQKVKEAIDQLKNKFDTSQIIFEASGGITEENIDKWAQTGVDILSLGMLTHSSHVANLSLDI